MCMSSNCRGDELQIQTAHNSICTQCCKPERINQRAFFWVWGWKEGLNNHLLSASKIAGLLPECQESPAIGEGSLQRRLLWPPWIFKGMHWVENISSLKHCGKHGAESPASQAACLHVLLSFCLMWGTCGSTAPSWPHEPVLPTKGCPALCCGFCLTGGLGTGGTLSCNMAQD